MWPGPSRHACFLTALNKAPRSRLRSVPPACALLAHPRTKSKPRARWGTSMAGYAGRGPCRLFTGVHNLCSWGRNGRCPDDFSAPTVATLPAANPRVAAKPAAFDGAEYAQAPAVHGVSVRGNLFEEPSLTSRHPPRQHAAFMLSSFSPGAVAGHALATNHSHSPRSKERPHVTPQGNQTP